MKKELVGFLKLVKDLHDLEVSGKVTLDDYHNFQLNHHMHGHGNGWYPVLFQMLRNDLDCKDLPNKYNDHAYRNILYVSEKCGYEYKRKYVGFIQIDEYVTVISYIVEGGENGVFNDSIEIVLNDIYYFIKNTDDKIIVKTETVDVLEERYKIIQMFLSMKQLLSSDDTSIIDPNFDISKVSYNFENIYGNKTIVSIILTDN